ncbi:MAG: hypothetical protein H0U18_15285 [Pyrinomonadaceae bacterium]|nr:hypothetical protein [Pyrinomonadaceae bacterium]
MPELKLFHGTRIVATPAALDTAVWPQDALALRLAPDEVFVTPAITADIVDDQHAIVAPDAGFAGAWIVPDEALEFLQRSCEWELPLERPAFAQGAVAGLPVKLWLEDDRVLFLVPAPYATDLEERMA